MPNDRMVYKHPGIHEIHGGNYDYKIIDDTEEAIAEALSDGWRLTTTEALNIEEEVITESQSIAEYESNRTVETNIDPTLMWASAPILDK